MKRVAIACVVATLGASCTATLDVPPASVIACAKNADCPADYACIHDRCLSAALECVVDTGGGLGAAPDGTACNEAPDGVCVSGFCFRRGCGDGLVDGDAEQCDFGADNDDTLPDRCRTDCTLPRCGDGVIDRGESCDDDSAECDQCAQLCAIGKADCDGAPGCECAPKVVVDTGGNFVEAMVIGDDGIYALGGLPSTNQQIVVFRVSDDGSIDVLSSIGGDLDLADAMFLDDDHVYTNGSTGVVRLPRAGGDVEPVAPQFRFSIDDDSVFTFDDTTGVLRVDKKTLAQHAIFDGPISGLRTGVAVAGHAFVATDFGDIDIVDDNGALQTVTKHQLDEGTGVELVTDGHDLYWLADRAELWRVRLDAGQPAGDAELLATGPAMQAGARTYHLSVDEKGAVYAAEIQTLQNDGKGGIMDVLPGRAPRMRARHVEQENAVSADLARICFSNDFSLIECVPR